MWQKEFDLEKHSCFVLFLYRHKLMDITDECPETIDTGVEWSHLEREYTHVPVKQCEISHHFTSKMDLQITRWPLNAGIIEFKRHFYRLYSSLYTVFLFTLPITTCRHYGHFLIWPRTYILRNTISTNGRKFDNLLFPTMFNNTKKYLDCMKNKIKNIKYKFTSSIK